MARRSFLRGRSSERAIPLRPPWALSEAEFTERCTRCGDCLKACPTGLLQVGAGGFPLANFSVGTCNFCTACVTACVPGALIKKESAWDLVAIIGDACLAKADVVCRTCGEMCDIGAIRFHPAAGGVARPQVNLESCTGCGECLATCPTRAIAIQRQPALEKNA